jgi:hypothetical protein
MLPKQIAQKLPSLEALRLRLNVLYFPFRQTTPSCDTQQTRLTQ